MTRNPPPDDPRYLRNGTTATVVFWVAWLTAMTCLAILLWRHA